MKCLHITMEDKELWDSSKKRFEQMEKTKILSWFNDEPRNTNYLITLALEEDDIIGVSIIDSDSQRIRYHDEKEKAAAYYSAFIFSDKYDKNDVTEFLLKSAGEYLKERGYHGIYVWGDRDITFDSYYSQLGFDYYYDYESGWDQLVILKRDI